MGLPYQCTRFCSVEVFPLRTKAYPSSMGNEGNKEVLDVSSMEELLVFAQRARRRRRVILAFKLLLAAALVAGLAYGGRAVYQQFTAQ